MHTHLARRSSVLISVHPHDATYLNAPEANLRYGEHHQFEHPAAGDAQACAFLELVSAAGGPERFGVGMNTNIVTASGKALLSGVNRLELVDMLELEGEAA